jgi:hypothetical protein
VVDRDRELGCHVLCVAWQATLASKALLLMMGGGGGDGDLLPLALPLPARAVGAPPEEVFCPPVNHCCIAVFLANK